MEEPTADSATAPTLQEDAVSSPFQFLLLTHKDTDTLTLLSARRMLPLEFPPIETADLCAFSNDSDMTDFLDEHAKSGQHCVVLVRLLGRGVPGFQHLLDYAKTHRQDLIVVSGVPGSLEPDLTAMSTCDTQTLHQVVAYFNADGCAYNMANMFQFLADRLMKFGFGYERPTPQPNHGLYHPNYTTEKDRLEKSAHHLKHNDSGSKPTVAVLFYRCHYLSGNTAFVDAMIDELEALNVNAIGIFTESLRDEQAQDNCNGIAVARFPTVFTHLLDDTTGRCMVDVLISTMAFCMGQVNPDGPTLGSWASAAMEALNVPVIQAITSVDTKEAWQAAVRGLNPLDTAMNVAIPEFDGRIITVPISFKAPQDEAGKVQYYEPLLDRIETVSKQATKLAQLKHTPNAQKKVAFLLTNSSGKAQRIGDAVGLDTPASLMELFKALQQQGYDLGDPALLPKDGDALFQALIDRCSYDEIYLTEQQLANAVAHVPASDYEGMFDKLPKGQQEQMVQQWGPAPGEAYVHDNAIALSGLFFGNVFVALQPPRGYGMDPDKIYHTPDLPPPHNYYALYRWLRDTFQANAICHMGKHGTLEWLPGKGVGLSKDCYPDSFFNDLPLIYPFILNDPGEGTQSKRRVHAVIIDHLTPPMTTADGYGELAQLMQLVDEYYQVEMLDPSKMPILQRQIWELIQDINLGEDLAMILNHDHEHEHEHEHEHQHGKDEGQGQSQEHHHEHEHHSSSNEHNKEEHDHSHKHHEETHSKEHDHSHKHHQETHSKEHDHSHKHHEDQQSEEHDHSHKHHEETHSKEHDHSHKHHEETHSKEHDHSHKHHEETHSKEHDHSHKHHEDQKSVDHNHSHKHHPEHHEDGHGHSHKNHTEHHNEDHSHSHGHNEESHSDDHDHSHKEHNEHNHSHKHHQESHSDDHDHSHSNHNKHHGEDTSKEHDHSNKHHNKEEDHSADSHDHGHKQNNEEEVALNEAGTPVVLAQMDGKDVAHLIETLDGYLCELAAAQIRDGLHILGQVPEGEQMVDMLHALTRLPNLDVPSLRQAVASLFGLELYELLSNQGARLRNIPPVLTQLADRPLATSGDAVETIDELAKHLLALLAQQHFDSKEVSNAICQTFPGLDASAEISEISDVLGFVCKAIVPSLEGTTQEIKYLLAALNGEFVPAGPSGSPTRGMAHVLPTGRNFYAVDPNALPSMAAWEVGQGLATEVLARYLKDTKAYPEHVAISVWGTAAMRTHGDDIAEIFALLGVRPTWQRENHRVTGVELMSLSELGRPRIDVTIRISGFFRDAFPHLITLLDDAVNLAINADEPLDQNFIRKHYLEDIAKEGTEDSSARYRVFGCPPGAYGIGILDLIEAQNWEDEHDFAKCYINWGGYAYSSADIHGVDAHAEFTHRLTTVEVAIHNQDDREHDIFDSDDYFQFHGGMIATIKALSGKQPKGYFGDSQDPLKPKVRDIKEESLRVYRTRVVNPKWLDSIMRHGYKGASEMAATVDYLFGFDATANVISDFMYEQVAQSYALDKATQDFYEECNPWALAGISERLLEAAQRGMWAEPNPETLEALKQTLLKTDSMLEGRGEQPG